MSKTTEAIVIGAGLLLGFIYLTQKKNPLTLAGTYRGFNYYSSTENTNLWLFSTLGVNVGGFGSLAFLQTFVDNNYDWLLTH